MYDQVPSNETMTSHVADCSDRGNYYLIVNCVLCYQRMLCLFQGLYISLLLQINEHDDVYYVYFVAKSCNRINE